MNIQTQISTCLINAKAYAGDWLSEIVTNEKNGLDQCCELKEITLYTKWINMLQDYYNLTYGGVSYYDYRYLTQAQALRLMARINSRDFKPQAELDVSVSGSYNNDFNNDFQTE